MRNDELIQAALDGSCDEVTERQITFRCQSDPEFLEELALAQEVQQFVRQVPLELVNPVLTDRIMAEVLSAPRHMGVPQPANVPANWLARPMGAPLWLLLLGLPVGIIIVLVLRLFFH